MAKQGDAGTPSSALLYEEPASCKAVKTKCPKLADSNVTGG
jgi:hypothetical protein